MDGHYVESIHEKQQCINHGLQIIDEDFESDDDDEMQGYWFNQQLEYRDREEVPPLDQQRRLGLDIGMIGGREENLCSTRSQTSEMRLLKQHSYMEKLKKRFI